MRRLLCGAAAITIALAFAPSHAAMDLTRTIELPAGGTYDLQNGLLSRIDQCRMNPTPANCTPQVSTGSPTGQNPVSGDVGLERGALSRAHRCLYVTDPPSAQTGSTGRLGFTIDVTAQAGLSYSLTALGANAGLNDFDIKFYRQGLGGCAVDPPAAESTVSDSNLGNESGKVPAKMAGGDGRVWAIVVLFAGVPQSQFRFRTF